jgi:hypothetical protein
VEYMDEGSAGVAKDALHNYKLDGESKIKVRVLPFLSHHVEACIDAVKPHRSRLRGNELLAEPLPIFCTLSPSCSLSLALSSCGSGALSLG